MRTPGKILTAALVLGVAAGVVIVVVKARSIKEVATQVADDIEAELNELDPVTKAAVLAKLSSDTAREVRAHSS
jgi:hypothetical protein